MWAPLNSFTAFCNGVSRTGLNPEPLKGGGSGFYNSCNALRSRTWWDMSSAKVKNLVNEKGCRQRSTMRVTDVKTQIVNLDFRNAVIVKVDTDEGISGMSETTMKR